MKRSTKLFLGALIALTLIVGAITVVEAVISRTASTTPILKIEVQGAVFTYTNGEYPSVLPAKSRISSPNYALSITNLEWRNTDRAHNVPTDYVYTLDGGDYIIRFQKTDWFGEALNNLKPVDIWTIETE